MLIEFRVKNYRSIKDKQLLTMVACDDSDLPEANEGFALSNNVADISDELRVVKTSAIYGANASGKTNIVKALYFVEQLVRNSTDNKPEDKIDVDPFRLDPVSMTEPSEFELEFLHEGVHYKYGFIADQYHIHSEWLYSDPDGENKKWFTRIAHDGDYKQPEWSYGDVLKEVDSAINVISRSTIHNTLFLSRAANMNNEPLTKVREWFVRHLYVFGSDLPQRRWLERITMARIADSEEERKKITMLVHQADKGVVDLSVQRTDMDMDEFPDPIREQILEQIGDGNLPRRLSILFQHLDSIGNVVNFQKKDQSLGTRRMFDLSGVLLAGIEDGDVLVIDELDSSLHSLLARQLIELFHNPEINSKNAQMIFNTHDSTLMNLTLLRRDQINFAHKNRLGETHLYSLLDFDVPGDEPASKGYLAGRYGAVPSFEAWEDVLHGE